MSDFFFGPTGELKTNDQLVRILNSASFQKTVTDYSAMCENGEMESVFDSKQKNIIKAFAKIIASGLLNSKEDAEDLDDDWETTPVKGISEISSSFSEIFYKTHDKDEIIASIMKVRREMKWEYKRLTFQADLIANEIENDPHFNSGISGHCIKTDKKKARATGKSKK